MLEMLVLSWSVYVLIIATFQMTTKAYTPARRIAMIGSIGKIHAGPRTYQQMMHDIGYF